jgi:predicted RNase H-like nuclease (RuvC/YqgF family)
MRHAESRVAELEAELSALRELLEEKNRTTTLLEADLKRYRYAYNVGHPNCPERVPKDQLQLGADPLERL